ncbi:MAG: peptidoglycan-binding protein [Spirochaetia bacterium]|nr:peptidoglycan-binding protein [Spirochaetia bacterium]
MKKILALSLLAILVLAGCSNPVILDGSLADEGTAEGRYAWPRTLREGMSGADVKELQIRVAGWAADGSSKTYVALDGQFGPGTKAAVIRFQRANGLVADGIVGPATQAKLNALQDADGSTAHFAFSEFYSKDGSGFSGGKVSATTVKENVRRLMWKLEALRQKCGNRAITINSGFRSIAHNRAVGGASNSMHLYGIAADIVVSGVSVATVRTKAMSCGFSGIITYGTFNHVDSRMEYPYGAQSWYWAYD